MEMIFHQASTRGHAHHGWLESFHTFSFANYYEPSRLHFGALRVLNDDKVAAGRGFGRHPHDNMEIVSIPLAGALAHQDSMGNSTVIRHGEVQIMSAGTGVYHSEMNHDPQQEVKFLQIWVFPKERNITPRYDQMEFPESDRMNAFQTVVSPLGTADGGVKINQDAWFSLANFTPGQSLTYSWHTPGHGVYLFVLEGNLKVEKGQKTLSRRDGLGIWDTQKVEIQATSDAQLLVMEVPLKFSA